MNKTITILLMCLGFPIFIFAQKSKKSSNTISISTSLNYYPSITSYSFLDNYTRTRDQIDLTWLDASGGTFEVEPGQTIFVNQENKNEFPTQVFGAGIGVRVMNENALFYEISLAKLSTTKSIHSIIRTYADSVGQVINIDVIGYDQRSSVVAFRLEAGKYFGWNKRSKVLFGFSGGIEPTFYSYKRNPQSSRNFPIKARTITLKASLAPILSFKLSKKVFLDFKPIGFAQFGAFENVKVLNPIITSKQQEAVNDKNVPGLSFALTMQLRFNIVEPKRKKRTR